MVPEDEKCGIPYSYDSFINDMARAGFTACAPTMKDKYRLAVALDIIAVSKYDPRAPYKVPSTINVHNLRTYLPAEENEKKKFSSTNPYIGHFCEEAEI